MSIRRAARELLNSPTINKRTLSVRIPQISQTNHNRFFLNNISIAYYVGNFIGSGLFLRTEFTLARTRKSLLDHKSFRTEKRLFERLLEKSRRQWYTYSSKEYLGRVFLEENPRHCSLKRQFFGAFRF